MHKASDARSRLAEAMALQRQNNLDKARTIYQDILRDEPEYADALHWFGVLHYQQGQSTEAVKLIQRAIVLRPGEISYHIHLGNIFAGTNDLSGSEAAYHRALLIAPNNAEAHCNLGITLMRLDQWEKAETHLRSAIKSQPTMTPAIHQLAQLLQQRGQQQEAIQLLQESLYLDPRNAQTHVLLARIYASLGDAESSLRGFDQALKLNPNYAEAYLGAAEVLYQQEQYNFALQAASQALKSQQHLMTAQHLMVSILSQIPPGNHSPDLTQYLIMCFRAPSIDHQALAKVTANQLLHKYNLRNESSSAGFNLPMFISQIAHDELWLRFLANTINTDPTIETWLLAIRRVLLLERHTLPDAPKYYLPLMAALGLQAFANEYIFHITEAEKMLIDSMQEKIHPASTQDVLSNLPDLLSIAMYCPLWALLENVPLNIDNLVDQHPLVPELFQYTVLDIREEQLLRTSIESVAPEQDAISKAVRTQYEENPYPRWKTPPAPHPNSLRRIIESLPGFNAQIFPESAAELLIAGCGTGYEPIDISLMDNSLAITAVDLSTSSLAYALRMAKKLNVNRVQFLQGDILELHKLGKQFDILVSTGVLHHMADPQQGWQRLCEITKPGGVQRISLYSERARRHIVAARDAIAALRLASTPMDIRIFRKQILAATPDSAFADLQHSDDLYSMSGCRDLLFHTQEHRFDLRQIEKLLQQLGLTFIAMELQDASAQQRFQQLFPEKGAELDPGCWDIFEEKFPDTFAGMYQFWCQKIA